jgi:hypothetical protein
VDEDGWWKPCVVAFHVSRTWPLAPTAASWFRGAPTGGDAASLAEDDGVYMSAKAGLVLFPSEPPAQLVCDTVAPTGQVLGIEVDCVAKVNTPGLAQRVEVYDWTAGAYVACGTQAATMADSVHTVAPPGPLARFVQPGTGLVRTRVAFYRTGLTLLYPWTASVDQVRARVRVR